MSMPPPPAQPPGQPSGQPPGQPPSYPVDAQGLPNPYQRPSGGGWGLPVVFTCLGILVASGVVVVVLIAALWIWVVNETGPGVEGPDDGNGGVVVFEAPDYSPPPTPSATP